MGSDLGRGFGSGSWVQICTPTAGGLEGSTPSQSVMFLLPPGGHVHPNTSHTCDVSAREDCEVTHVGSATAPDGRPGTSNVPFTEELFSEVSQAGAGTYPFSPAEVVSSSGGWGRGPLPVLLRQRNC